MHIGWGQQPGGFVSIIDTPPKELENFELLKSLETTGNFWCVTDPSTKLYGRICFKAGHSIKLFLDGTFGPNLDRVRGINFGIIHGQLFNGARCSIFKAYGHVEVFVEKKSHYRTEITADLLLLGYHYQSKKEIQFSMIDFVCTGLNDWFTAPLQIDYEEKRFDNCKIIFKPDTLRVDVVYKSVELEISSSCNKSIPFGCSKKGIEFYYQYIIHIKPKNPQSYDWYHEVLVILREFFTFIIGRGAYSLDIKATSVDNVDEKEKINNNISIYLPVAVPKTLNSDSHYIATQYDDIKDIVPEILSNWFDNYDELKVVASTYCRIITHEGESVKNIFMQVVQNLEHFHGIIFPKNESRYLPKSTWRQFRGWLAENIPNHFFTTTDDDKNVKKRDIIIQRIASLNKLSFRSRLEQIFNSVNGVELMPLLNNPADPPKAIDSLLKTIENTRNYYTHFDRSLKKKQVTQNELVEITYSCWAVLTYILAKKIGFNDENSGDMAYKSKFAMFLISRQTDL